MRMPTRVSLACALASILACALAPASLLAQGGSPEWLREATRAYRSWGRVDGPPRFAPFDCRIYTGPLGAARRSSAGEHSGKVYFLYTNGRSVYLNNSRTVFPRGFTVVKEAFATRTLPAASDPERHVALPPGTPQSGPNLMGGAGLENYHPRAEGGEVIGAGEFRGLFVMHFVGPGAPRSDDGWRYATVSPAGRTLRRGALRDCMACHAGAPRHRLFGVQE